jgi:hypothetical protein
MYSACVWRVETPGHDELRCVLFLINGTVMEDHLREQVASTPLGTVRSSSCPVQTLVGTSSRRRGAVKWERDQCFQAEGVFSALSQAATEFTGAR